MNITSKSGILENETIGSYFWLQTEYGIAIIVRLLPIIPMIEFVKYQELSNDFQNTVTL